MMKHSSNMWHHATWSSPTSASTRSSLRARGSKSCPGSSCWHMTSAPGRRLESAPSRLEGAAGWGGAGRGGRLRVLAASNAPVKQCVGKHHRIHEDDVRGRPPRHRGVLHGVAVHEADLAAAERCCVIWEPPTPFHVPLHLGIGIFSRLAPPDRRLPRLCGRKEGASAPVPPGDQLDPDCGAERQIRHCGEHDLTHPASNVHEHGVRGEFAPRAVDGGAQHAQDQVHVRLAVV